MEKIDLKELKKLSRPKLELRFLKAIEVNDRLIENSKEQYSLFKKLLRLNKNMINHWDYFNKLDFWISTLMFLMGILAGAVLFGVI